MNERTQFMREQKEIEFLAQEALDEAIYLIQQKLGIKHGDFAGHFFSDEIVLNKFIEYIEQEKAQ